MSINRSWVPRLSTTRLQVTFGVRRLGLDIVVSIERRIRVGSCAKSSDWNDRGRPVRKCLRGGNGFPGVHLCLEHRVRLQFVFHSGGVSDAVEVRDVCYAMPQEVRGMAGAWMGGVKWPVGHVRRPCDALSVRRADLRKAVYCPDGVGSFRMTGEGSLVGKEKKNVPTFNENILGEGEVVAGAQQNPMKLRVEEAVLTLETMALLPGD
ncbi:hypothetical protein Tco_0698998 [Tanacetum coccineum]